jgi:hypothetical protein
MPTLQNLMGSGNSVLTSIASLGQPKTGLAAGGTVQTDAPLLATDFSVFSSATGNLGARLPASGGNVAQLTDTFIVVNHSGSTLKIYPPVGGTVANATTNTAFSVATGKTAYFLCLGAGNWAASLSA